MQGAFPIVLVVVLAGAVIAAAWAGYASRRPYERIGRGGLSLNEDRTDGSVRVSSSGPSAGALAAEREAEIRQMLEARNARRARRGEAPIDVEAELRSLLEPRPVAHDPALVAEVRELVVARNERRVRRGQEPLDVEEEVARQLRDLS